MILRLNVKWKNRTWMHVKNHRYIKKQSPISMISPIIGSRGWLRLYIINYVKEWLNGTWGRATIWWFGCSCSPICPGWITFDRFSHHFRSIRNFFLNCFTKWPPATILNDRKSLSIKFLVVLDQYATFNICEIFHKMDASGHFGWPKIIFYRIYRHFRSMRNFIFFDFFHKMFAGGHFGYTENHFLSPFQINAQLYFLGDFLQNGDHFKLPKITFWSNITFDRISRCFRSMRNF